MIPITFRIHTISILHGGMECLDFPGGSMVKKNLPAVEIAGDSGDKGSTPGSGRPLDEEITTHSSILAWEIPWTENLDGLQSMRLQIVRHN